MIPLVDLSRWETIYPDGLVVELIRPDRSKDSPVVGTLGAVLDVNGPLITVSWESGERSIVHISHIIPVVSDDDATITDKEFSRYAYEKFKEYWKKQHHFSRTDFFNTLDSWRLHCKTSQTFVPYEDFLHGNGYDESGSCYPRYQDFCENEYQSKKLMDAVLGKIGRIMYRSVSF